MTDFCYLFKFIIIGDSSFQIIALISPFPDVGKSCIVQKFMTNQFSTVYDATIGIEFGSK